jgi:hypothetical protein
MVHCWLCDAAGVMPELYCCCKLLPLLLLQTGFSAASCVVATLISAASLIQQVSHDRNPVKPVSLLPCWCVSCLLTRPSPQQAPASSPPPAEKVLPT